MSDIQNTYEKLLPEVVTLGDVKIADEVVAVIAGLACVEVEGVASMAGNISGELISKLGLRNLSKGVKVEIIDSRVVVDIAVKLYYETNIPQVSAKIQEKVKFAIENMTGLEVLEVNVKVVDIAKIK